MMFIIGFMTCWMILAIFIVISDWGFDNGIDIDSGWGTYLITFPALIFLYPASRIYRLIRRHKEKKRSEENGNSARN